MSVRHTLVCVCLLVDLIILTSSPREGRTKRKGKRVVMRERRKEGSIGRGKMERSCITGVEEKRNFSTPPTKQLLNCAINKNLGMNSIFSDQTTHSGYSPLVSILSYHCCSNDRFSCSVFLRGKCQY